MRKLLLLVLLLLPCLARAQGVSVSGSVTVNTTVSNVPGFTSALQAVSNATITVCSSSGGGTPCAPTVTIYSNAALTTTAANPLATCVGAATQGCIDANGNFQFWVPANSAGYLYSQTGPGIVGKLFAVGGNGTAVALASAPTQCGANNFSTGIATSGNANCAQPSASNLSDGVTGTGAVVRATSPALVTPSLASPTVTGTPTGVGIVTSTMAKGTNGGNYSSASTTPVNVDGTNLAITKTIPLGWKLTCSASGSVSSATAAVQVYTAIADGGTPVVGQLTEGQAATVWANFNIGPWVINGDGNSHAITLQYATTNGADSVQMLNSTSNTIPLIPVLTCRLEASN